METAILGQIVRRLAEEAGFDRCGIAVADRIGRAEYLESWLASGRSGSMAFMKRYFEERVDPRVLLPGARSVIVVALSYKQPSSAPHPAAGDAPTGRVAMYAWGKDYHKVVKRKLFTMLDRLRERVDTPFEAKACVDTAPLLEREVAAAAGLGWIGKNTMVLHEQLGSYFFIGAIVTTLAIAPDEPSVDHCGTCTRCLDACPTNAFPSPYEMDASRCISYLTIERREAIPDEFHAAMGDWIFGCDICQEVCPFNRDAPITREPAFAVRPPAPRPPLREMAEWGVDDYCNQLRGSAMKRAKLPMLQRNARIALDNASRAS